MSRKDETIRVRVQAGTTARIEQVARRRYPGELNVVSRAVREAIETWLSLLERDVPGTMVFEFDRKR